ncbi:uncharacterized protein LOC117645307 [Thrips palmi]|uniref:Uncharacterized protein LOC117645307 n=1 Tax=Thrips palmi TaxID=161013 RepID=A0A6P8YUS7_THRPL|nr:uncharacterized protein LOC117645307 [Thrips palmi]XP_034241271.1 uncharacterized protein LOC117645307 [Thrips palmi]
MDQSAKPTEPPIDQLSLNLRIKKYKECCYRSYAAGLAALSIATSASYFILKKFPIYNKYSIVVSGGIGSVVGYIVSKEMSQECNLILKAHRESMRNPVQPDSNEGAIADLK